MFRFEQSSAHRALVSQRVSSTAQQPRPAEPGRRSGGEPTRAEAAILAATERLLQERALHELSVADIIDAAGISRTSFYAYFPSKMAVIATGLRQVMDQVMVAVEPLHADKGANPEAAVRVSLQRWVSVCKRHGALLRAVSEQWPHDDELRELWSGMLDTMAAGTARVIGDARGAGVAPPGAPARSLAACLMWGYERVLHVALVGDAAGLPGPDAIVEPLTQMMVGGLYGRPLATESPAP
jgi:TetR/AcrR family transcriptional regulator, ethionamide resistance regulator